MAIIHNSEGADASIDDKFRAAVDIVQNLPKDGPVVTTTDEKLAFYSLYKQATVGPCNTSQPGFWNVVEKFKWEAWKKLGSMESNEAKNAYINRILRKIMDVNREHDTEEWMRGELADQLMPKFAILGLHLRRRTDPSAIAEEEEELSCPDVVGEH
ncbi:acyl CoA binding protein [Oesophagostomum dentatum]|uniref:Acyl CoA binding protein n=1 Tax=Oesophagostomum dentatum TaxID=61180 RepID=A0A0B1SFM6_OESDE|nr:acyl CoA binding protein [Oesophagostomum dentatum]